MYLILHTHSSPSSLSHSYPLTPPRICRVWSRCDTLSWQDQECQLLLSATEIDLMACRGIPLAEIPLPQAGQARLQGFQVFILTSFPNILCGDTGEINHYGTAATEPKQLQSASGEKRIATISPECWEQAVSTHQAQHNVDCKAFCWDSNASPPLPDKWISTVRVNGSV